MKRLLLTLLVLTGCDNTEQDVPCPAPQGPDAAADASFQDAPGDAFLEAGTDASTDGGQDARSDAAPFSFSQRTCWNRDDDSLGTSYAGECVADAGTCFTKYDFLGDAGPNPPVCCCPR